VDLIRQARLAGRDRGEARVRGVTAWVAAGCVSAATVIGLLLPGGSASASPEAAATGDDGLSAADPSDPAPAQAPEQADGAGSADDPAFSGSSSGLVGDRPVAPIVTPQAPRAHVQRHRQVTVLQPPVQAPVRAPRAKSHARSGAS
jgi:hypothetical protein